MTAIRIMAALVMASLGAPALAANGPPRCQSPDIPALLESGRNATLRREFDVAIACFSRADSLATTRKEFELRAKANFEWGRALMRRAGIDNVPEDTYREAVGRYSDASTYTLITASRVLYDLHRAEVRLLLGDLDKASKILFSVDRSIEQPPLGTVLLGEANYARERWDFAASILYQRTKTQQGNKPSPSLPVGVVHRMLAMTYAAHMNRNGRFNETRARGLLDVLAALQQANPDDIVVEYLLQWLRWFSVTVDNLEEDEIDGLLPDWTKPHLSGSRDFEPADLTAALADLPPVKFNESIVGSGPETRVTREDMAQKVEELIRGSYGRMLQATERLRLGADKKEPAISIAGRRSGCGPDNAIRVERDYLGFLLNVSDDSSLANVQWKLTTDGIAETVDSGEFPTSGTHFQRMIKTLFKTNDEVTTYRLTINSTDEAGNKSESCWMIEHHPPVRRSHRYAWLVGSENYGRGPLSGVVDKDILPLCQYLKREGEHDPENIKTYTDTQFSGAAKCGNHTIQDPLTKNVFVEFEEFLQQPTQRDASVLFYFSGHGNPGEEDEPGCLLVSGGDKCYPISNLIHAINTGMPREIVVILDACFSGGPLRQEAQRPDKQRYVISATKADTKAVLDNEEGSPLTKTIIAEVSKDKADGDSDGLVTIEEVHDAIVNALKKTRKRALVTFAENLSVDDRGGDQVIGVRPRIEVAKHHLAELQDRLSSDVPTQWHAKINESLSPKANSAVRQDVVDTLIDYAQHHMDAQTAVKILAAHTKYLTLEGSVE